MDPVRQRILVCLISVGLAATAMHLSDARALDAKQLSFYHTHTHKRLDIVYFENGEYVDSALEEINRYLGDFRTGDTTVMDHPLLSEERYRSCPTAPATRRVRPRVGLRKRLVPRPCFDCRVRR